MSTEPNLLNAAVTIAFGALAGGITNAVAIWMLFHPYQPRGLGRLTIHGAIPKNKPRLAKTIGRTVGQRLLTSDDLARQLSAPELRNAFDNAVRTFVVSILETERDTLRTELPAGLLDELRAALGAMAPSIADRFAQYTTTDEFRETVARLHAKVTEDVGTRPLSDFLNASRRDAIRERVEEWVGDAVMSPGLESTIGRWLDAQVTELSDDSTPLLDRLPTALVAAVEKEIAAYLPMAIDRIATSLSDPEARRKIQSSLHRLFEGFVNNLLLHERIVARLVVTERTIARLLDNVERDGVEQVSKLLDEPEMRTQIARSVNDAVVKFLRRPMAEHLRALGPERVEGIKETLQGHIMLALRDPNTREYAIQKLDSALDSTQEWTWNDVLKHLPPADIADWAAEAITTPRVREWIAEGATSALDGLLDRPIGRPSDHLPDGSIERIAGALSPAIWDWIQRQVPGIVAQLDIQQMVEEKVLGFSLRRIEEIVRRTTQRELDIIVRLGYVLGAVVGALAYAVSVFLP